MFFKENNFHDHDNKAEHKYDRVPIFGIQLRHIAEIHAVPTGQQG